MLEDFSDKISGDINMNVWYYVVAHVNILA